MVLGTRMPPHKRAAFGLANRHAWQYTVFAAEFDTRDSEEKFYPV
jgi:hypothetical protein